MTNENSYFIIIHSLRAVFNWVSKGISRLLWFCFTVLCDWLTKFAPLSQPMRSKTKTNRSSIARVFPRLAPVTWICFEFWLVHSVVYVFVIGRSNYFGFGFTTLNWKRHVVKHGLDWISKTWTGLVKHGLVKHGLVKHGFVKHGFVKHGFVKHGFVKHGLRLCASI